MQCTSSLQIGNWGVHTASTLPEATEAVSGRAVIKKVIFWLSRHSFRVQTIFPTWLWGWSTSPAVPQNCLNPEHHHRSANGGFAKDIYLCHCQTHQEENGRETGKKCAVIVPTPSSLFLSNLVLDIIRNREEIFKKIWVFFLCRLPL